MLDEKIFNTQKSKDKLFVLLFLYNKNIKINLATIDNDVAVYGSILIFVSFILFLLFNIIHIIFIIQYYSYYFYYLYFLQIDTYLGMYFVYL